MPIFVITFKGSWLGGKAVVAAPTRDMAYSALKKEYPRLEAQDAKTLEIKRVFIVEQSGQVLFLDDGEY